MPPFFWDFFLNFSFLKIHWRHYQLDSQLVSFAVSLHVHPVHVCFLPSRCSSFLPQSENMHLGLIGTSTLTLGRTCGQCVGSDWWTVQVACTLFAGGNLGWTFHYFYMSCFSNLHFKMNQRSINHQEKFNALPYTCICNLYLLLLICFFSSVTNVDFQHKLHVV